MKLTIAQLNEMEMSQVWSLYADPGEDEVIVVDWRYSTPDDVEETWADWASNFVADNRHDVAYDGFVGFNDRTDLDIYRQLRAIGFFNLGERE